MSVLDSTASRRTLLRGMFGGGALLAAAPVIAACGSDDDSDTTSASATSSGLTTVTCQLGWKKLAQFGGHFAALKNGYFTAEGIDAKFLSGGPNIDPVSVVSSGQADIGDANGSDIMLAVSKGIPVQAFATIYQMTPNALMSLGSNPVPTLSALAGKKVGLPTTERPLLTAMLTRAGVDPTSVKMLPVGTDPSILTSKQVDAYIGYGTQQGLSLQQAGNDVKIIYFSDLGNPDYGNALFAKAATLSGKKDLMTRWLRADRKGWEYFVAHPEEIAQYTYDQYHNESGAVLADEKVSAKAAVPLINGGAAKDHGLMWIQQSSFAAVYELYRTAGLITKPVDYSKVMTDTILTGAGA
ncbi:Twin-arginine translocation pathway signal protein [Frankia canadensis]|uniref:Thiamine pyrimidine synthase n=1 Tax=Frankia canadensis TaxID=1836972 RepID=A0A2I2L1U2_9ACTN|nr:ABC transporter substrate-binding protein [Frankia canadensis]SNQ51890.1 Twin-arginine translocation pathway signal protein [Frankia canadensis]SOU59180.1 Twin-arginine translocation pathway signal protein [Frankia canadensis]